MTEGLPLFGDAPIEPPRDYAREVFDLLNARVVATKRDLGIRPAQPASTAFSARRRKAIEARIRENGGGEEGFEACRRVIAVDEAECRLGPQVDAWRFWNADTPFRNESNFERRLDRWRADGRHVLWGERKAKASPVSDSVGRNAALIAHIERMERGECDDWGDPL